MSLVLRIHSSAGRSRVAIDKESTVLGLKNEVEKRLIVPVNEQMLKTENGVELANDNSPLSQYNLEQGAIIILTAKNEANVSLVTDTSKCFPKLIPQAPTPEPSPTPATKEPELDTTNGVPREKDSSGKPNFSSFDQFLNDNNFNTNDLPFRRNFHPQKIEKGKMNKLPPPATLNFQKYRHVDHILLNQPELENLISHWKYSLQMIQQKIGIMYGYFLPEEEHYPLGISSALEAVLELPLPPASTCPTHALKEALHTPNNDLHIANKVAERLGLEPIGVLLTHLPRDASLAPQEVMDLARYQLEGGSIVQGHFTGYPVTKSVICTLTSGRDGSEGTIEPRCFMLSDLGLCLVRDDVIESREGDEVHLYQKPVEASKELAVDILEKGKKVDRFDATWFLVRVNDSAAKRPRTLMKRYSFPRENREVQPTAADISKFLDSSFTPPGNQKIYPADKYADFHFLLYIAKAMGVESVYPLCDAIVNRTEVPRETIELIELLKH